MHWLYLMATETSLNPQSAGLTEMHKLAFDGLCRHHHHRSNTAELGGSDGSTLTSRGQGFHWTVLVSLQLPMGSSSWRVRGSWHHWPSLYGPLLHPWRRAGLRTCRLRVGLGGRGVSPGHGAHQPLVSWCLLVPPCPTHGGPNPESWWGGLTGPDATLKGTLSRLPSSDRPSWQGTVRRGLRDSPEICSCLLLGGVGIQPPHRTTAVTRTTGCVLCWWPGPRPQMRGRSRAGRGHGLWTCPTASVLWKPQDILVLRKTVSS